MKFAHFLLGGVAAVVISSAASAADVPMRGPVYTKAPVAWSWEGQYIGVHGGYFWGQNDLFVGAATTVEPTGGYGGLQFGYLHHLSRNWVIGYEVDVSFGNIDGASAAATNNVNYFGTARTRLGYAQGPLLIYGTAGLAWAMTDIIAGTFSTDRAQIGYAIGAGIEYAFAPNWSAKVEYLYMDLGNTATNLLFGATDLTASTVRVGLNYRFANWNPAQAHALPVKAPVYNVGWSGPYIGIHGSYVTGDHDAVSAAVVASNRVNGGMFGIQSGYNWQLSRNWVFGLEADSSWGSADRTTAAMVTDIDATGTVRVRTGYVMNNWLVYGTGGLAWMHADTNHIAAGVVRDQYYLGWTAGAGIEYALSAKWSAKLEYLYAEFDNRDIVPASFGDEFKLHTIKVGLNYRAGIFDLIGMRW